MWNLTLSAAYSDGEYPEENVDSVCIDNGGYEDVDSGDDGVGDDNGDDDDKGYGSDGDGDGSDDDQEDDLDSWQVGSPHPYRQDSWQATSFNSRGTKNFTMHDRW